MNFMHEFVMKENCIIAANLGENALLVSHSFQQSSQSQKMGYGNREARWYFVNSVHLGSR